jgi:hypothetical protein
VNRAALKLADDAPLHLHEPKGHFDTNMTLACVVIEIIISLIPLIDTSVDQDNVLSRSICCICNDTVSHGRSSNMACKGHWLIASLSPVDLGAATSK